MIVWNGVERIPAGQTGAVVTIGNFDGVHLGHQAILASAVADARSRGVPSILVTFDPHPLAVVDPDRRPKLLQTRRQKLDALEAAGLAGVVIVTFDAAVAARSGREFLESYLGERLSILAVHVGESFRFGHARAGNIDLLRSIGAARGFDVVAVPSVRVGDQVVSSSAIRAKVADGDVEGARAMLGRPFALTGVVVRGEGRGRSMQFPTANLDVENELLPRRGVYVTEAVALALRLPSITNVGVRPTFDGTSLVVETHVIDFDEDLYAERMEVRFLARIRDEKRFSGPIELADQIARDRAAAVGFLKRQRVVR
jgi:riboflavin kinase/FMN adenylyltransferase